MNLYVGNLSRAVTEADLRLIFEGLGEIVFAQFVGNNDNDRTRGFAFARVDNEEQARNAIAALHGKFFKGLMLVVRELKDQSLELGMLRASLRSEAGVVPVGERHPNAAHLHLNAAPVPLRPN